MAFIYCLIMAGFLEAGVGFWRSTLWPTTVGEMLVHEARKRGVLEAKP